MISDLQKANYLLNSDILSLKEIAQRANLPYQSIRRYKSNISNLTNATAGNIEALSNTWNNTPTFNLLSCPWIKVLTLKNELKTVSLTELFKHAHKYSCLAGDSKAQDLCLLRVIIAIVISAYNKPCVFAEYVKTVRALFNNGKFDATVLTYLQKHKAKFDLLSNDKPFYQVNKLTFNKHVKPDFQVGSHKGYVEVKQINRNVNESGNSKAIFSPSSSQHKQDWDLPSLTRWLITYQNYSGISDKSKVTLPNAFKSSYGELYSITPVIMCRDNLFETIVLEMSMLNKDLFRKQTPVWELNFEKILAEIKSETREYKNTAEILTSCSRMLHIHFDNYGKPVVYSAVMPRANEKSLSFDIMAGIQSKSGIVARSLSKSHRPLLFDFGLIKSLKTTFLCPTPVPLTLVSTGLIDDGKSTSRMPVYQYHDEIRFKTMEEVKKLTQIGNSLNKVISTYAVMINKVWSANMTNKADISKRVSQELDSVQSDLNAMIDNFQVDKDTSLLTNCVREYLNNRMQTSILPYINQRSLTNGRTDKTNLIHEIKRLSGIIKKSLENM